MTLIEQVKNICSRLAPFGWRDLLLQVSKGQLDITSGNLVKPLNQIDRSMAGFGDFFPAGPVAGLVPSSPARSLLFHALASPLVHPPGSSASLPSNAYPSLEELDTIENCIYALTPFGLKSFLKANPEAMIVVFAYEYRPAARTPHGKYADTVYSRVGVARVGTAPEIYDASRRSFRLNTDRGDVLAAMPARYGAFLALPRTPLPTDAILEATAKDLHTVFHFPVRKIFAGRECFNDAGTNVKLDFSEFHRNEKLRRAHTAGGLAPLPGFNINLPPFVRDSKSVADLVTLRRAGASVLVVPSNGPLVRTAMQKIAGGKQQLARFKVPREDSKNRFETSYQSSPADQIHRLGPEYVNIRQEVTFDAQGQPALQNLNLLGDTAFKSKLAKGGYEAAHFIDDSCDGALLARISGIDPPIPSTRVRAAYSLVTAPDFFPLVDQFVINKWAEGLGQSHFAQGGPDPLSRGRSAPNITLPRPGSSSVLAFDFNDKTMPAVISILDSPSALMQTTPEVIPVPDLSSSHLPDAAASVFEPGWDVSITADKQGREFYATWGLGSPFPEDAKLCAALNSFWPAVAPDASRTFGMPRTAIPLLDLELGLHPNHPAVGVSTASKPGWDGEFGPFFETIAGVLFVNFCDIGRSDYVVNALAGLIRPAGLELVDAEEMIARMEALRASIRIIAPGDSVSSTDLRLVTVEKVADWVVRPDRGDVRLENEGFRYVFAKIENPELSQDLRRRRAKVAKQGNGRRLVFNCQLAVRGTVPTALALQQDAGSFRFFAKP